MHRSGRNGVRPLTWDDGTIDNLIVSLRPLLDVASALVTGVDANIAVG
jgi:hypothetical protein